MYAMVGTHRNQEFKQSASCLIGTGRIADHIDRGTFRTDKIQTLILDEFDKSLQLFP
jgi:superfamily II DNA/RNA helicase